MNTMKLLDSKIEGSTITFTFEGGQVLKAENYGNGSKYWYLNGQRHREDGPAVEWANGDKEWFLNGELHREDGPAVELANGDKEWYLNGKALTEERVLKNLKVSEEL